MFDFLLPDKKKPHHDLVTSIIIPDGNRPQPPRSPAKQPSPKKQSAIELPPQQQSQPFNHEKYLLEELQKSQKKVGYAERQGIEQQRNYAEQKVHDLETGEPDSKILDKMFQRKVSQSPGRAKQIAQLIDSSNKRVQKSQQMLQGSNEGSPKKRTTIPKSKDDLKELEKVDKYRLLKIKNGEIKNKVGDLREQLEIEYYRKKAAYKLPQHENVKESDYYSIENPRTKEANKFIHELKSKRQAEKEKFEEYKMRKMMESEARKEEMFRQQEEERERKKKRLEELFMEKLEKRKEEEQMNSKKKSEIAQWSKLFQKEKPLHIRKEEEYFENVVIPDLYEKQEKLLQKKMEMRPIDIQEIEQHDERYMEFKRDDMARKEAQIELTKERERELEEEQDRYYKGKYRYLALDELMERKQKLNVNPAEEQRMKKAREIVYADYVKQMEAEKSKLKPLDTRESQKKKFVKRIRNINGSMSLDSSTEPNMSHRSDSKSDGKKNLHFLHELVREKGIPKDRPNIRLVEEKGVYQDYLQELREKRKTLHLSRIDAHSEDSELSTFNVESLKAQTDILESKRQRGELRRKHQKLSHEEDMEVEDNEVRAIKMKMQLLNTID